MRKALIVGATALAAVAPATTTEAFTPMCRDGFVITVVWPDKVGCHLRDTNVVNVKMPLRYDQAEPPVGKCRWLGGRLHWSYYRWHRWMCSDVAHTSRIQG